MPNFNPRSREGSDPYTFSIRLFTVPFQSTLPRRERLCKAVAAAPHTFDFNPRSREGSDLSASLPLSSPCNFNPRSREGSDVTLPQRFSIQRYYFNPRSREGSDGVATPRPPEGIAFQSTLPRRERPSPIHQLPLSPIFQSTLPRRERPRVFSHSGFRFVYFNPRSREGSDDHPERLSADIHLISIHAPAKGATGSRRGT